MEANFEHSQKTTYLEKKFTITLHAEQTQNLSGMAEIRISNHARTQMLERGISEEVVMEIIAKPQQTIPQGEDRVVYQSVKYFEADDRNFLVRVFVNIIKQPNLVITVYRTTKIAKYWKDED